MKLEEIQFYSDKVQREYTKILNDPSRVIRGRGTMAVVHQPADNNHDMDVVTRTSSDMDPQNAFVYYLLKNGITNPFLPQCKAITDNDGITSSVIERLVPIMSPVVASNELIRSQAGDWFAPHVAERILQDTEHDHTNVAAADALAQVLWDVVRMHGATKHMVKNPDLQQALTIIQTVKRSDPDYIYDITEHNMMWRITGTRPQLVITDPISTSRSID